MSQMDSIPQARVVRKAGQLMTPPPAPPAEPSAVAVHLRNAFAVAMGLWPLTAVMLLAMALLIMAANAGGSL